MTDPDGFVPYNGTIANNITSIDPASGAIIFPTKIAVIGLQATQATGTTTLEFEASIAVFNNSIAVGDQSSFVPNAHSIISRPFKYTCYSIGMDNSDN